MTVRLIDGSSSYSLVLFGGWILAVLFGLARLIGRLRRPAKASAKTPDYRLQFPPSRRHVLLAESTDGKTTTKIALELKRPTPEPFPTILQARALPTTRATHPRDGEYFTPTGFSTRDIRALGRFPDYAVLSGVRHPQPCDEGFDITKAAFRPFRPFRWGYHQTMALMKLEPDYWIELERNYVRTMAARQELLKTHGERIFFHEPGSELACRELMEMVVQFLCKRYPRYFRLENDSSILVNTLLDTRTDLLASISPLDVVAANVPEDFALMLRSENDGLYYLRAAVVCSSVGWDVAEHRNEPLRDIHTHVPDYAAKMAFSMDRFFVKMPTDQPIQRCSWTLEDCSPLFSSPVAEGPSWRRSAFAEADLGKASVDDVKLRCDWQTLRRLPLSGAIVFNFKAVFTPLTALRTEPFVPALLARVLREGAPHLMTPKAMPHVKGLALAALEGWARRQVEGGVVPEGWEARTLDEHPFYPGWEERWRSEQGG